MGGKPNYDLYDEVVVLRMLAGTYRHPEGAGKRVHAPERAEAVRRLVVREGLSDGQVAHRLNMPRRSVLRIRRRRELPPNFASCGANQFVWQYRPLPARSHSLS